MEYSTPSTRDVVIKSRETILFTDRGAVDLTESTVKPL